MYQISTLVCLSGAFIITCEVIEMIFDIKDALKKIVLLDDPTDAMFYLLTKTPTEPANNIYKVIALASQQLISEVHNLVETSPSLDQWNYFTNRLYSLTFKGNEHLLSGISYEDVQSITFNRNDDVALFSNNLSPTFIHGICNYNVPESYKFLDKGVLSIVHKYGICSDNADVRIRSIGGVWALFVIFITVRIKAYLNSLDEEYLLQLPLTVDGPNEVQGWSKSDAVSVNDLTDVLILELNRGVFNNETLDAIVLTTVKQALFLDVSFADIVEGIVNKSSVETLSNILTNLYVDLNANTKHPTMELKATSDENYHKVSLTTCSGHTTRKETLPGWFKMVNEDELASGEEDIVDLNIVKWDVTTKTYDDTYAFNKDKVRVVLLGLYHMLLNQVTLGEIPAEIKAD